MLDEWLGSCSLLYEKEPLVLYTLWAPESDVDETTEGNIPLSPDAQFPSCK